MYKNALMMVASGAVGVAQTFVLQRYVDQSYPQLGVPQLGGYGKPSTLISIVAGAAAIAAGIYGMKSWKAPAVLKSPIHQGMLFAYGGTALASGLIAGYFSGAAAAKAFPRSAAIRAVPSGYGYSQVNRKETNIL